MAHSTTEKTFGNVPASIIVIPLLAIIVLLGFSEVEQKKAGEEQKLRDFTTLRTAYHENKARILKHQADGTPTSDPYYADLLDAQQRVQTRLQYIVSHEDCKLCPLEQKSEVIR